MSSRGIQGQGGTFDGAKFNQNPTLEDPYYTQAVLTYLWSDRELTTYTPQPILFLCI